MADIEVRDLQCCRWCGATQEGHGTGNNPGYGPHEYLAPTPEQVEIRSDYNAMLRQVARGAEPVNGVLPEPNACLWCGKSRRGHGLEWHPEIKYHRYMAPPEALIKARMLARQAQSQIAQQ
jgi:hypothetical protein